MKELVDALKVVLADTFALYLKAHYFHWNIEGPNFVQYHGFLDDFYNEVWAAVDLIAEHIRALDAYAPGSFTRFKDLTTISDELAIPSAISMLTKLEADNQKVIDSLTKTYKSAEEANKIGLSNFIQDRIDIHEKHSWMLRSIVKA
jgi:starvation-inducible DNA-binding protein